MENNVCHKCNQERCRTCEKCLACDAEGCADCKPTRRTTRTHEIPSHALLTQHIISMAMQATPAEVASGATWYAEARAFATTLAVGTPYTPDQLCGVIAALSPQCPWAQNKVWAKILVAAHAGMLVCPPVSTRANRNKAWRILNGERPEDVLGGPKVTAFYANLIGDTSYVTVDLWAYYVATGTKLRTNQGVPRWAYAPLQDAYREAARILGVSPSACQAMTWVAARGSAN